MPQSISKSKESVDWSAPSNIVTDELELKWSDEEEEFNIEVNKTNSQLESGEKIVEKAQNIDFIAQHLKFIAILRIMMDEMSTLASGFEIDGDQLRFELFKWLERECGILHEICDFRLEVKQFNPLDEEENFDDLLKEDERFIF